MDCYEWREWGKGDEYLKVDYARDDILMLDDYRGGGLCCWESLIWWLKRWAEKGGTKYFVIERVEEKPRPICAVPVVAKPLPLKQKKKKAKKTKKKST